MPQQPLFTYDQADAALCIFDELLTIIVKGALDETQANAYWDNVQDHGGTPELRRAALLMAEPIEKAWRGVSIPITLKFAFDFGFVPAVIDLGVFTYGTHELTEQQWQDVAQVVVDKRAGEGDRVAFTAAKQAPQPDDFEWLYRKERK